MPYPLENHPHFVPWTDPVSDVHSFLLNEHVAPAQTGIYSVNPAAPANEKWLRFGCGYPSSPYKRLSVVSLDPDVPRIKVFQGATFQSETLLRLIKLIKRNSIMSPIHPREALGFCSGVVLAAAACLALAGSCFGQATHSDASKTPMTKPSVPKTFIDYFRPTPPMGPLAPDVWGAAAVGPRDPKNGLEDQTMTQWDYWDGQIIRAKDGKYHMFASRWDQAKGHNGWFGSQAVHAVSDKVTGPYTDKGLCWPDNEGGKGHNVTALVLPDGSYAVVVSETRPGDVFVSKSLDGPWDYLGRIKVAANEFSGGGRMSNVSIMVRPDGGFQIVPRSGAILLSKTGILGPYTVQGPSIYPTVPGLPQHDLGNMEDPVVWFSGGLYHITVNNWSDRKAYHLTSVNGITGWTYRGLAYDPTVDFVRYTNGTVNHWNKLERPSVLIEKGHVVAVTLAVIDVPKDQENGNDHHGSKVIVIPFDGAALDRDLSASVASTAPAK